MAETKNKSILLASISERSNIPVESLYFIDKQTLGVTRNAFLVLPEEVPADLLDKNILEQVRMMKQMISFITSPHTSFKKNEVLPYIELALLTMMDITAQFRIHNLGSPSIILPDEIDMIRPGLLVRNKTRFDEFGIDLQHKTFFPPSYDALPHAYDSLARTNKMMNVALKPIGGKTHVFTANFLIKQ